MSQGKEFGTRNEEAFGAISREITQTFVPGALAITSTIMTELEREKSGKLSLCLVLGSPGIGKSSNLVGFKGAPITFVGTSLLTDMLVAQGAHVVKIDANGLMGTSHRITKYPLEDTEKGSILLLDGAAALSDSDGPELLLFHAEKLGYRGVVPILSYAPERRRVKEGLISKWQSAYAHFSGSKQKLPVIELGRKPLQKEQMRKLLETYPLAQEVPGSIDYLLQLLPPNLRVISWFQDLHVPDLQALSIRINQNATLFQNELTSSELKKLHVKTTGDFIRRRE